MAETVQVEHVSKWFRRYTDHPGTLKEALLSGFRRSKPEDQFWALDEVSLSVQPGCMLGIIGQNGAGKSTLLRLIGGVGRPDRGKIQVRGRVGALLDLGAGFHADLTGRENVYISGVITGLTRREVERRFDSIVAFSELEEFVDNPLRTYSTGMQMRLAFAVAAHIDPEVLLVDEVLAVGDLAFQRKCLDRIARFKADGTTILLVSHDISSIRQLCDEVLWLRHGQVVAHGPTEVVVGQYVTEMTAETRRRTPVSAPVSITHAGIPLELNQNRFGSLEVVIEDVLLYGPQGLPAAEIDSGDPLAVEIEYQTTESVPSPIFGVTISTEDGFTCYDSSTDARGPDVAEINGRGLARFSMDRLDLMGGQYYIDVGIYKQDWAYAYDYHWHVYSLTIRPTKGEKGILRPPGRWDFSAGEGKR